MKKNLWVLLALSALIAMFVIAGCAPKPSPTPTPTPTTSPTTPPADADCPEVVSTDVYKYYGDYCNICESNGITVENSIYTNCLEEGASSLFKIVITFDENIDPLLSSCLFNPANWYVEVANPDRVDDDSLNTDDGGVLVLDAEINGKQVIVTAEVVEFSTNTINPNGPSGETVDIPFAFCGLICSTTDAVSYRETVNDIYDGYPYVGVWPTPDVADEIYWELDESCIVADELGNYCCGYDGYDCCVEPICEECIEPCPLGSSICL